MKILHSISKNNLKFALLAASALGLVASSAAAYDGSGSGYYQYDGGMFTEAPGLDLGAPVLGPSIGLGFDGISQVDVRALHSNFSEIPPDTMGAIGATQFMETSNGAYAVYNKVTGAQESLVADGIFWANAGQPASNGAHNFSNGDSRVLFDAQSQRWVVESFGASLDKIQIAVSTTSNALGPWKSVSFEGFADGTGTGIADYPTLAIDSKAVYIGTNDFTNNGANCAGLGFCGTTLDVISRNDLFGASGPSVSSLKQFFTPYGSADNGYAIQGVNQLGNDTGKVIAVGVLNYGLVSYNINNPGTAGATQGPTTLLDPTPYDSNAMALQPDGSRAIDTLDDRVSSAAWEYKGKIYAIHTITPIGGAHTELQWYVVDAKTKAVIQEGVIGDGLHDFFQGAITINKSGQVVIAYNESGADMNISVLAQQFNPIVGGNGAISAVGSAVLLKVSPIDDYHNGSVQGAPPSGRQRWGDYAQVTVDPNNPQNFWVIGEYALGYLPDPKASLSRWGTWIDNLNIAAIPEPGTWAMMIMGAGMIGVSMRRRRKALAA